MREEKLKPTFIMVPRKLMITWIVTFICMVIMGLSCIQWTNYVNRKSNQRWCAILTLSIASYKDIPNPTEVQVQGLNELRHLIKDFKCK